MNGFLGSLRADLSDRRLLPVLAVLAVALLGALAYVALGGGSSSTPTPAPASIGASSPATGATGAVAISQAPASTAKAVAETTSGASQYSGHSGHPRNPFTPLPQSKSKTAAAASTSTPAPSPSGSGSESSPTQTTPAAAPQPSAPAKPKVYVHYHVTVQFGLIPATAEGAPPAPAQLKTYADMPLHELLPGKEDPQLAYSGVTKSGKEAMFSLTGEAILHGGATCKPSPTQCEAIALQAGQSETLEVIGATGQVSTYELKLLSIEKSQSTTASAARAHAAGHRAGKHAHRR